MQVRLPAVVIGGGLTGIDTATELFAYYPVQVEKMLEKFEEIVGEYWRRSGLGGVLMKKKREFSANFSFTAKRFAKNANERQKRAKQPNFVPLVQSWGGVSLGLSQAFAGFARVSPESRRSPKSSGRRHQFCRIDESPTEAVPDEYGAVKALIFEKQNYDAETGKFSKFGRI